MLFNLNGNVYINYHETLKLIFYILSHAYFYIKWCYNCKYLMLDISPKIIINKFVHPGQAFFWKFKPFQNRFIFFSIYGDIADYAPILSKSKDRKDRRKERDRDNDKERDRHGRNRDREHRRDRVRESDRDRGREKKKSYFEKPSDEVWVNSFLWLRRHLIIIFQVIVGLFIFPWNHYISSLYI